MGLSRRLWFRRTNLARFCKGCTSIPFGRRISFFSRAHPRTRHPSGGGSRCLGADRQRISIKPKCVWMRFILPGSPAIGLGDYDTAIIDFQRTLLLANELEDQARANFWIGKAQQAKNDLPAATVGFSGCAESRSHRLLQRTGAGYFIRTKAL